MRLAMILSNYDDSNNMLKLFQYFHENLLILGIDNVQNLGVKTNKCDVIDLHINLTKLCNNKLEFDFNVISLKILFPILFQNPNIAKINVSLYGLCELFFALNLEYTSAQARYVQFSIFQHIPYTRASVCFKTPDPKIAKLFNASFDLSPVTSLVNENIINSQLVHNLRAHNFWNPVIRGIILRDGSLSNVRNLPSNVERVYKTRSQYGNGDDGGGNDDCDGVNSHSNVLRYMASQRNDYFSVANNPSD